MKLKTINLIGYRTNDYSGLIIVRDKKVLKPSDLFISKNSRLIKIKISHNLAEKVRIKQEIKHTDYKGYANENIYQLADVVEEKIQSFYQNKCDWNDWCRVFAYECIYDVAFNRGVRQERERKQNKNNLGRLTGNDISELARILNLTQSTVDHAVMEIIARKRAMI